MSPPGPEDPGAAMSATLAALWDRFQGLMEERVQTLHELVETLAHGPAGPEVLEDAASAAHKLAGTLGTFGLQAATDDARAMEHRLLRPPPPSGAELEALRKRVHRLKEAVEAGPLRVDRDTHQAEA